jgi:phospholipase C
MRSADSRAARARPDIYICKRGTIMGIENIDHFVVLMLENRSFDHVFGMRPGVDGLKGTETNTVAGFAPAKATGGAPFDIPTKNALGPLHNVVDVNLQLYGDARGPAQPNQKPSMDGFAASYLQGFIEDVRREPTQDELALVMRSFDPGALPAISQLADNFVLCDKWFCEVPGPTHPNRLYVHAGTSAGFAHNVFDRPFDLVTIYELLKRSGKTWASYYADKNEMMSFTRIANDVDNFKHFEPQFFSDIDSGKLPNYSFIVPRFTATPRHPTNSQHAPHDVRYGDHLIADIYEALVRHEPVWNKSAFIITYDEHGGFYDHVAPPAAPNPDDINSPRPDDFGRPGHHPPPPFTFDRLGPRVPTLIISPWVDKQVCSTELRHTSILRTVRERFGITRALSKRESSANTFSTLFDRAQPRTGLPTKLARAPLPTLAPPDHHANPANAGIDDLQREIRDGVIAVTRRSHPEDEDKIWLPKTQGETSDFIRQRWTKHKEFLRQHQA